MNNYTGQLFTPGGQRKYLTSYELDRFLTTANAQERLEVRSFCLLLAHTGSRISEALALTPKNIDLEQKVITIRTLRQRTRDRFRAVPVPSSTIDTLEMAHSIRKAQHSSQLQSARLWRWGRTQGFKHVKAVMAEADIQGVHASPNGLRHGFGVWAIQTTRNPRFVQKWLGHRSLETTAIYMDILGQEEREAAQDMWI